MGGPGRRIFRVVGAVVLLPLVGGLMLLAAGQFHDPDDGGAAPVDAGGYRFRSDVTYGRVGGTALRLDVYEPTAAAPAPRPATLVIHGGGWIEGDKASEAPLAAELARRGFVAFSINYRLASADDPSNCYPAAVLDARRAARWVRTHAAEYGADPEHLGAVGLSAGGHLAALLGTTEATDEADPNSGRVPSRVDCVVDTAGPTDFTDEGNPPVTAKIARCVPTWFGKPRDQIPDAYRAASPVFQVDGRTAPTLVIHGTADELVPVEQARRFARALDEAHVAHRLVLVEGESHVFRRAESYDLWLDEMTAFLREHLKP